MKGLLQALEALASNERDFDLQALQLQADACTADGHIGKCCSQCGATKTPQWREGPDGPKTLCNACGVKRCRQTRVATDGKKPPAPAAQKQKAVKKSRAKQQAKREWEHHGKRLRADADGDEAYFPAAKLSRPHSPEVDTPTSSSSQHRPQRKAAARAASRTAEYAATGHWNEEELLNRAGEEAQLLDDNTSKAPVTESAESMGRSSATAEDLAWHPSPAPSAAEALSPVSAIGDDSSAAINLMAMSMRSPQSFKASRVTAQDQDQAEAHMDLKAMTVEELRDSAEAMVEQAVLPMDKRLELQNLLNIMHVQEQRVVCAEAAVSAVAQVLANKQSMAIQARIAQQMIGSKLQTHVMEFLARHGGGLLKAEAEA